MDFLIVWLAAGVVCFFLARASWQLTFGCAPIRVKTMIGCMFAMWLPPATLLAALVWFADWLCDDLKASSRGSGGGWFGKVWNLELANPCKWFSRKHY